LPIAKFLPRTCALAGIASLLALAGCGGSGVITPHQTGNYSNASFSGSYVFEIHGFLSQTPYREIGVITADGAGNITSGVDELNTFSLGGAIESSSSITGTYNIANDGTGEIFLNATALGELFSNSQITLAVTLVSTSEAQLMEADLFAQGSGDAELQTSVAEPSGPFVFRLHQENNAHTNAASSEVGLMNISGGNLSGNLDQNLTSASSSLTLSGSLTSPSPEGIGTGTYTDSLNATTNFVYCVVSSGKFVFLVIDSNGVGSGNAEMQQTGASGGLSGTYVFGSRGDDTAFFADVATVGRFTANGTTISNGSLDAMDEGNYSGQIAFTGTANAPSSSGREAVSLSIGGNTVPAVYWMVSPSRAFFLFESIGSAEDGTLDLQTTSSFSNSTMKGQFALGMDGIDTTPEGVSRIGTYQFNGSGRSTVVEIVNDSLSQSGATSPGTLAGTYGVTPGGRITTTVSNGGGALNLVMYAASGSRAYALQADQGTNTSGTVELQQ